MIYHMFIKSVLVPKSLVPVAALCVIFDSGDGLLPNWICFNCSKYNTNNFYGIHISHGYQELMGI